LLLDECEHSFRIRRIHGDGRELARDAGVAWRTCDAIDARVRAQSEAERMLAGAAAHDEDFHLTG
jgi:hypothetical protein